MTTTNNTVIENIAAELNVTADKINNVREVVAGLIYFTLGGYEYTSVLTKTGKLKKNSTRRDQYA